MRAIPHRVGGDEIRNPFAGQRIGQMPEAERGHRKINENHSVSPNDLLFGEFHTIVNLVGAQQKPIGKGRIHIARRKIIAKGVFRTTYFPHILNNSLRR